MARKYNDGTLITAPYSLSAAAPIDPRDTVSTYDDLTSFNTFIYNDSAKIWYDGMKVTCLDSDSSKFGLYILSDSPATKDVRKNTETGNWGKYDSETGNWNYTLGTWTKLATGESLTEAVKDLGPVFKFKGVADSIDKDMTTLTIGSASYTKDELTYEVRHLGTYQDLGKNPFYAWGYLDESGNPVVLYYTQEPEASKTQWQMKSDEIDVEYFEYKDTTYYKTTEPDVWESVGGDKVTVVNGKVDNDPITIKSYKAYEFVEATSDKIVELDEEKVIPEGFVDLGLPNGTLWATCNLGATSPCESGLLYQFGRVDGYAYGSPAAAAYFSKLNPPTTTSGKTYGTGDVLDPVDDAAYVASNGVMRMPIADEITELLNNTTNQWVSCSVMGVDHTSHNVMGRLFTSKIDSSKTLFFPAAGVVTNNGSTFAQAGSYGYYWSSSV